MKKYICFILGLMTITFMANAQAPQAIPYQGVARNASGSIIASHAISLRISIHDLTATGPVVLSENHSVTTTALGLFNLDIGTGTQLTGTLAGINWGSGAKYIQVEMDALGGSTYVDMGTAQLNSVPYALYAGKAASLPDGTENGNTIHWNGTEWVADNSITNNGLNVGIGTSTPGTKLDINGDMGLRSADIIIAATSNYALDVYTDKQSVYRLLQNQPGVGDFGISGLDGGGVVDGRLITFINSSGATLELYNDMAPAHPYMRIITGTGNSIFIHNGGTVTFRYDASIIRWEVIHSTYSFWKASGNNISNINTGNVGIGTTSPGYKLDVRGDARLQGNGLFSNGTNGGALRIETNNFPGTQSQFLNIDGQQIQSVGNPNIQTVPTPKNLYINPFGGNVGIGIAGDAPYKLSIYQPVIDAASTNTFVAQLRGQNPILHFVDQYNTSRGYIKGVTYRAATPHFSREGIEIGTGGGDIYFTAAGYLTALMINGTNNNVGIGTNNPSEKLSVNGTIRSKEVVVEINNWPDYVFDNKYKLQPLEEIEQFIKKNNRLPGIASAAEIQANGLKVGELQTKMMEKIEQLTLYIIELKKEVQVLQSQILLTTPKN